MKHILKAMLAIFCLISTQVNATIIELELSDTEVAVGDRFILDVHLSSPFEDIEDGLLFGFGFDLEFDTNMLTLVSSHMNSYWMDVSSVFANTDIAGSSLGGIENVGQAKVTLAQLEFAVLKAGTMVFNVMSSPEHDGEQGLFYLSGSDLVRKDVSASTQMLSEVPSPQTVLLLILAMSLLMLSRQRSF